jgi:hypothetical protein
MVILKSIGMARLTPVGRAITTLGERQRQRQSVRVRSRGKPDADDLGPSDRDPLVDGALDHAWEMEDKDLSAQDGG